MNDKETEYYASEFSDAQIDTMADAGDFYLKVIGLLPNADKGRNRKDDGRG